jgi:pantoate--beta-alanine ligase
VSGAASGLLVPAASLQMARTPAEVQAATVGRGTVGLVPTMGALHDGHATLIRQARAECDLVVVSIFVNPLQFGPTEDLSKYPRDLERDCALAKEAGADLVFHPEAHTMYPAGFSSLVRVGGVSEALEGAARPGHFDGVATVVLKLLNLVRPDRAYFGEKDWQQLTVVRRMVSDLNVSVQIVGVPTIRIQGGPADGLAMSSRNSYLNSEQQARASVLPRALRAVQAAYAGGEQDAAALLQAGTAVLQQESEIQLDYLSVVDAQLQPVSVLPANVQPRPQPPRAGEAMSDSEQHSAPGSPHNGDMFRVLVAARMYGVRLIDNMPLVPADDLGPGLAEL